MDATNILILRSVRILIACAALQREFSIGYQDMLKDKCIRHLFTSGQTVGQNNEALTTSPFYVNLIDNNTTIFQIPNSQLLFNTFKLIDIGNYDIDWQSSKIVFPTNLVAATNVELIAYYEDKNPPRSK